MSLILIRELHLYLFIILFLGGLKQPGPMEQEPNPSLPPSFSFSSSFPHPLNLPSSHPNKSPPTRQPNQTRPHPEMDGLHASVCLSRLKSPAAPSVHLSVCLSVCLRARCCCLSFVWQDKRRGFFFDCMRSRLTALPTLCRSCFCGESPSKERVRPGA